MTYSYTAERPNLFTETGQLMLLKIRDNVHNLLESAGAFKASAAWRTVGGDSWMMLACLDRLVELKEIRRLSGPDTAGQDQVFDAGSAAPARVR